MRTAGVYEVIGPRGYRGHAPGVIFTAHLDINAERRAVGRGAIKLLDRLIPALEPGSYQLPQGWADRPAPPHTEAPKGASLIGTEGG